MTRKFLLLFAMISILGCSKGEESTPAVTIATVTCTATDCADSSANAKIFYYAIITNSDTCSSFDNNTTLAYVKGPMSCSAGTCTGASVQSSFLNAGDDTAIATPAAGSKSVFYYIDTDGNESPDNGEPGNCEDGVTWNGTSSELTMNADLSGI
ncbi:MAG: hypothetical protein H6625_00050 [Bdellovibrionaceae bacterium]|nr:hypothetical protein [Pseudobdellovibrionaceae bacterium]